jgi:hypothetical protein
MMKRTTILAMVLLVSSLICRAQFSIGINGGVVNPTRAVSDSLTILRSGFSINIDPSYSFGKFSINSNLGYQSFNIKSGFDNMAKQKIYIANKGYAVNSNAPYFYNVALGAGFNVLPSQMSNCGISKPSLIISSQFGILKPVNPTDVKVSIDQKATIYSLTQSNKTLPYFKVGADIICPLNNLFSLKSGISYNQTTSKMQFQQSSNGNVSSINVNYSNVRFSVGIQFSFKGISEKGIKRSAANNAKRGDTYSAVLNTNSTLVESNKANADSIPAALQAEVAGQPIGGIVVKGGINADVKENPLHTAPVGEHPNVLAADVQNPLYNTSGNSSSNPIYAGTNRVSGQPIGGIVVKGGKNPGGNITVLNNGKTISEKGIKINDFAIKENGIKSLASSTQKGTEEKLKTQAIIYTSDFSVEDPMLLSYLGTNQLIIKKGEYVFDYSKNHNGDVKLLLRDKIIHRDIAARNLTFIGFNADNNTHFEYTIEPEYVNGVADHIIVSYKGITEKGIK